MTTNYIETNLDTGQQKLKTPVVDSVGMADADRLVATGLNGKISPTLLDNVVSDKNYVHVQNIGSTLWEIPHMLGKFPSITVVDSANSEMTTTVNHIDLNNSTVELSYALTGRAFCN